MIYGGDEVALLPFMKLYNEQLATMQINAAKDMYEKGLKQIEDFNKLYGDFQSPFENDQIWYNQNVLGKIQDGINQLYANGIDPLRSAEGRNAIQRLIMSVPVGTINAMKANAKRGEKFLDNMAILKQANKYSPDMDKALYGDWRDFSTVGDGGRLDTFDRLSPDPYQDINQLLDPIFKGVKPIYDQAATKAANDGMLHNTVSKARLLQALDDSKADLLETPSGRYLRILAEKEANMRRLAGEPVSADDVFNEWANDRLEKYVQDNTETNPIYMENLRQQNAIAQLREQDRITRAQWADPNNPAVIRANGGGNGRGDKTGLNHPLNTKNAALRNMAGVEDDAEIPAKLKEGQKAAWKTFKLKNNLQDKKTFSDDQCYNFLSEYAADEGSEMFKYYLGSNRTAIKGTDGVIYDVTSADLYRLVSAGNFFGNSYNMHMKHDSQPSLSRSQRYVMVYNNKHSALLDNNDRTKEGLLVTVYPTKVVESCGDKKLEIQKDRGIDMVYKLPAVSNSGEYLTYSNTSQPYITGVANQIGTNIYKQTSVWNTSDNDAFGGQTIVP